MSMITVTRTAVALAGAIFLLAIISCGGGGGGGESQSGPPPMQFGVPSGVTASDGTKCQRIEVTWDAMTGAMNFEIYRSDSPGGAFVYLDSLANINPFAKPVYTDNSAVPGTSYYYKVIATKIDPATGSEVKSEMSASDEGLAGINPDNPDNLRASDGDNYLLVEWSHYAGTKYCKLYRSIAASGPYDEIASNITVCNFTDSSAKANTHYFYKVKAFNDDGESDYSNSDEGWAKKTALSGTQVSDGTYSFSSGGATISYIFTTPDSCTKKMTAAGNTTTYTGTYAYNSGALTTDVSYEQTGTMKMQLIETYNAGYTMDSGAKLFLYSWEKTSGTGDSIIGKYKYAYNVTTKSYTWSGAWNLISTADAATTAELEYLSNHTWTMTVTVKTTGQPDQVSNDSGTWSDSDVENGSINFVSYNGKKYLYTGDSTAYIKE